MEIKNGSWREKIASVLFNFKSSLWNLQALIYLLLSHVHSSAGTQQAVFHSRMCSFLDSAAHFLCSSLHTRHHESTSHFSDSMFNMMTGNFSLASAGFKKWLSEDFRTVLQPESVKQSLYCIWIQLSSCRQRSVTQLVTASLLVFLNTLKPDVKIDYKNWHWAKSLLTFVKFKSHN